MNPRALAHQKADALLQKGEYAASIKVIEECLKEYGPHVGPLSDLVFTTYLNQDMGYFGRAVKLLEEEFQLAKTKLSPVAELRTQISLSKAFELLGRIHESFAAVDAAMALVPKGSSLGVQVLCQKLRLLASFGRESALKDYYRQCLGISESDPQQWIECFHALMIAEAKLFGLEATWPRFLALSKKAKLQAADLGLCLIDLLEIALETKDEAGKELILKFIGAKKLKFDQYEKIVISLAKNKMVNAKDVFEWTRTIPFFGIVRLLALALSQKENPKLRKQLLFHVSSLDHRSRRLVEDKWRPILSGGESILISLDPKSKILQLGSATLSFAKSQQSWHALEILAKKPSMSPESFLMLLGKTPTLSSHESLRISLLRLNRKLSAFLGLEWAIKFSKDKISLNPAIQAKII